MLTVRYMAWGEHYGSEELVNDCLERLDWGI